MATSYTTFLGLALPVTGELSGTWGDTVNNYISNYLDAAIAGAQTVTTDTTLTKTTGSSLGATSSQYAIIIASPASANITITAPAASKIYTIINTSGTYTVKICGAGPTTGVTLGVSEKAQVAWNGSDFVRIGASGGAGVFSSITNTGLTSGRVVYSTTGGLETDSANLLFNGTTLTANTLNLTNALGTTYGGTGLTSFTSGGVVYASSSSVLATGSALTFDGSQLVVDSLGTQLKLTRTGVGSGTLNIGGSGELAYAAALHIFYDATKSTEWMRLTSTGLGIGTSSPVNKLVVSNAGAAGFEVNPSDASGVALASYNRSGAAYANSIYYASNQIFCTGGTTEGMRLTSTGLGIGTSSPGAKLNISGSSNTLLINGSATAANFARFTSTGGDGVLGLESSTAGAICTGSSAYATLLYTVGATSLQLGTNSNVRATLDSSGNLGLGITPSAWGTGTAFQGSGGSLWFRAAANGVNLVYNYAFYAGANNYLENGYASRYTQVSGQHQWFNAPSGTAGNAITFTQAMTLDASGNLGIGISSPTAKLNIYEPTAAAARIRVLANGAQQAALQLAGNGTTFGTTSFDLFQDGGSDAYVYQRANANLIFATNNTERMRLDASGNLGLGVTPSAWGSAYKAMQLGILGIAGISIAGNDASIGTNYYLNSSDNITYATTGAISYLSMYNGQFRFYNAPSGTAGTTATITQVMTLDASGNLLVGTTSAGAGIGFAARMVGYAATDVVQILKGDTAAQYLTYYWNTATSGNNQFIVFTTDTGASARGSITYNRAGGLVVYNTTSDYRAKDIIGLVQDSGATIDALKVYEGQMKGATQSRPMLVAHEAQAITPYAVTGEKDAVKKDGTPDYQQMDVSSLVPLLIAEIQSLRIRIAQLEAK